MTTEESMAPAATTGGATWGIALIIGVLVLGGWALFGRDGADVTMDGSGDMVKGSLKELIALGGDRTCTYTIATPDGDMKGVVYTADGSSRSDVTLTTSDGSPMTMHSITDSEYMYSWSDAMGFGVKMRLASVDTVAADTQGGSLNADAYTQSVDFDCDPWSVDASVFVPPASVSFQDMSEMMQQMQQMQGMQQ